MSELRRILDLWKRASAANDEICLATVVAVEGSAYRRPGARMLLTSSGQRAGTVSGGCLEAEIAKKAWWLTEQGPSLQRYSSFFDDDGDMPYGLGCGGTVIVLLERGEAAAQHLEALRRSVEDRTDSVIVTCIDPAAPGTLLILNEADCAVYDRHLDEEATRLAHDALRTGKSSRAGAYFIEHIAPPPALILFGAGDDVQPLVEFASALGWHVSVADDRSNLARPERFPNAVVRNLDGALAQITPTAAAVIMSHSYEQDRKVLRALLARDMKYIGVLGPRPRTERLVAEIAPLLELTPTDCMARLHTPVGLDLGGHSPASIALSIAAELQAVFAGREARKPSSPSVHA
ncbi:MAG TPA: XdhC family protein [Acidobacteriaceae bacterium]|nr:XdhC family protein [Acidobacteriaceae bacterium]